MIDASAPRVVVSAGFSKTHMTTAAGEVARGGQLTVALTGAYPTRRLSRVARVASRGHLDRAGRLLERGEEIPDDRLRAFVFAELLFDGARVVGRLPGASRSSERLCAAAWRLYGWLAGRALAKLPPDPASRVYHFRAGYGQGSVDRAKKLGMRVLCDHAIAHPAVLQSLVLTRGRSMDGGVAPNELTAPLERAIQNDIERSDAILVNSEFVKETFIAVGWPADRVHVAYLGVDENFLGAVRADVRAPAPGPLRLLFAGRLERRKGADVLIDALSGLTDVPWELTVAGPVMPDVRADHAGFLADPRISVLGTLTRAALADQMLAAPVFVFPSYAEGSARVVFEALACGCYVITTPNAGTIVEDGVHGALVPPGDTEAVRGAVARAAADRARVAEIGNRNAALIRARYRQRAYGDSLRRVYAELTAVAPEPIAEAA